MELAATLIGSLLVGATLGWHFGSQQAAQKATNFAIATVACTAYLTYGEDWWEDFLEEIKTVKESEMPMIMLLIEDMEEAQKAKVIA